MAVFSVFWTGYVDINKIEFSTRKKRVVTSVLCPIMLFLVKYNTNIKLFHETGDM
jgi:hypothetical protein